MKSRCSSLNSSQDLLLAPIGSLRNFSFKSLKVMGDTSPFGVTPALNESKRLEPISFMKYSAKMLLLAFQVQRNSILNFRAGGFIGKLNNAFRKTSPKIPLVEGDRCNGIVTIRRLPVD